jgi:hypothetical protein
MHLACPVKDADTFLTPLQCCSLILITGDKDLLSISPEALWKKGIPARIVAPRDFLPGGNEHCLPVRCALGHIRLSRCYAPDISTSGLNRPAWLVDPGGLSYQSAAANGMLERSASLIAFLLHAERQTPHP